MRGYWQSPELSFFSGANKTRGWQATLNAIRRNIAAKARRWAN